MATIRLLTSNQMRGPLAELLPHFERESGHAVSASYEPAKIMLERIARGETGDLAILAAPAIDELVKTGKMDAASRRPIASCGVGIAVRAGARKPDIGTVEAFKKALLAAKSVAWTLEGASGIYFTKLIERLGIAAELQAKAVRLPGGLIGELIVAGRAELAVQQIPELLAVPGVELAGPLPRELQVTTRTVAGIFTGAKQPAAARALIDCLAAPAAAPVFRKCGHEPPEG